MATIKQKKAIEKIVENGGNVSKGMIDAGYSLNTAKTPQKLTKSKAWVDLMESYLSDETIAQKHSELLNATGIAHMVFPLDATDEQITALLGEANCQVKRFMHSETQTHVWFFAADNNARKAALDMAYKLKNKYQGSNVGVAVQINFGEDKENALKDMFQDGSEEDVPARFFRRPEVARRALLITDQKV